MDAGSEKDHYRNPLIAMSFFAVLFFIILVVILIVWCKKRRQTEVKTVVIQPKKRPISTRPAGNRQSNGKQADVEAAGVATHDIELSEGKNETVKSDEALNSDTPEHSPTLTKSEGFNEQQLRAHTSHQVEGAGEVDKGEVNPSFQKDDDDSNLTS